MLVKFEVYYDGEHWCARGIGIDIFTQGKSLDGLTENIKEAVGLHFEDQLQSSEDIRVLSISGPTSRFSSAQSDERDADSSMRTGNCKDTLGWTG